MSRKGLRAIAAGAPSNLRVSKASIGRRRAACGIGVHVPENSDAAMHLPSDDVMKYYADVQFTIVDWSEEVGQ